MKKFNQYIKESSSLSNIRESEFYVIMFEKSQAIPAGLIEDYKKSNLIDRRRLLNHGYKKYIRDFTDDVYTDDYLGAMEELTGLDTFMLIELGYQSKDDAKPLYNFINEKIQEFNNDIDEDRADRFKTEMEKWHGKLIMRKFITIAQSATGNLNL